MSPTKKNLFKIVHTPKHYFATLQHEEIFFINFEYYDLTNGGEFEYKIWHTCTCTS